MVVDLDPAVWESAIVLVNFLPIIRGEGTREIKYGSDRIASVYGRASKPREVALGELGESILDEPKRDATIVDVETTR